MRRSTSAGRQEAGLRLWTSRYQSRALAERDDLVKVRTTIGAPRFRLDYALEQCLALAPYGVFHLDGDDFERAYRARLDRHGVDEIRRQLQAISARHGGRDLVLLCFEDVWRHGEGVCHRRSFARWWLEQTGEVVEELPDPEAEQGPGKVTPQ